MILLFFFFLFFLNTSKKINYPSKISAITQLPSISFSNNIHENRIKEFENLDKKILKILNKMHIIDYIIKDKIINWIIKKG